MKDDSEEISSEFSAIGMIAFICQNKMVRIFPLLFLSMLTSGFLHAVGGAGGIAQSSARDERETPINKPLSQSALKTSPKAIFQRIVQARLFHSGKWTLPDTSQTPAKVARTLASLQPTFVAGMLRISDHGELSDSEVEAFTTVRTAVLAVNKNCRFDVLLNAGEEHSSEAFVQRMKDVSVRIHPDSWTFYVPPETKSISPEVFDQGISEAHAEGQMVGYDGPLSLIPEGVDFIVIRAWNFKVSREQIDLLRTKQRVPLIVELPTTFGNKEYAEVISYVEEMETKDRVALLANLAENQSSWGYRLAQPIFYPLYPAGHSFDATKDNILLVTIRALMAKFN